MDDCGPWAPYLDAWKTIIGGDARSIQGAAERDFLTNLLDLGYKDPQGKRRKIPELDGVRYKELPKDHVPEPTADEQVAETGESKPFNDEQAGKIAGSTDRAPPQQRVHYIPHLADFLLRQFLVQNTPHLETAFPDWGLEYLPVDLAYLRGLTPRVEADRRAQWEIMCDFFATLVPGPGKTKRAALRRMHSLCDERKRLLQTYRDIPLKDIEKALPGRLLVRAYRDLQERRIPRPSISDVETYFAGHEVEIDGYKCVGVKYKDKGWFLEWKHEFESQEKAPESCPRRTVENTLSKIRKCIP